MVILTNNHSAVLTYSNQACAKPYEIPTTVTSGTISVTNGMDGGYLYADVTFDDPNWFPLTLAVVISSGDPYYVQYDFRRGGFIDTRGYFDCTWTGAAASSNCTNTVRIKRTQTGGGALHVTGKCWILRTVDSQRAQPKIVLITTNNVSSCLTDTNGQQLITLHGGFQATRIARAAGTSYDLQPACDEHAWNFLLTGSYNNGSYTSAANGVVADFAGGVGSLSQYINGTKTDLTSARDMVYSTTVSGMNTSPYFVLAPRTRFWGTDWLDDNKALYQDPNLIASNNQILAVPDQTRTNTIDARIIESEFNNLTFIPLSCMAFYAGSTPDCHYTPDCTKITGWVRNSTITVERNSCVISAPANYVFEPRVFGVYTCDPTNWGL